MSSVGDWNAFIELPVDPFTTVPGTRELSVTDCLGGLATAELTFPGRAVAITPVESGWVSEVVIAGPNFPAANRHSPSDIGVRVE